MILTEIQKNNFLNTNLPLLYYVGLETGAILKNTSFKEFQDYDTDVKYECRNALLKNAEIIDEYIASNFDHLTAEQVEILNGYKFRKEGNFIIFKCLTKHAIFIDTSDNRYYCVKALSDPFDCMLDWFPAYLEKVTLLPYSGMIIYDGFFVPQPIHFGAGIRQDLNYGYQQAKKEKRIISTLR
jgi:hypothetical protein